MKSDEFDFKKNEWAIDKREKIEVPQSILDILIETATKIKALDQEADYALDERGDVETYRNKMKEKAQLLIDLPTRLTDLLEGVDSTVEEMIQEKIQQFALLSKMLTQNREEINHPGLRVILSGKEMADKDDLEKLIDTLEGN